MRYHLWVTAGNEEENNRRLDSITLASNLVNKTLKFLSPFCYILPKKVLEITCKILFIPFRMLFLLSRYSEFCNFSLFSATLKDFKRKLKIE